MTGSAWVETVSRLWPGADVRQHRRGTGPRPNGTSTTREFAYLPNAHRARILLPLGTPRAAATALRRYSHDLGIRARLGRGLLSTAVWTGLPQLLLPDRVAVRMEQAAGDSIEQRLAEILGEPAVVVSVTIGNARANRKPVLQAITSDGRSLAFVKVGDTDVARDLIRAEATALAELETYSLNGLHVPRVIHHGAWGDLELLVMSALPTGLRRWRPHSVVPVAAMAELAAATRRSQQLAASDFWAALREIPDLLEDRTAATRFASVLEHLIARYGDLTLQFGAWHGDWTPWNMAWQRDLVQLWDWERFAPAVPVGFDALHYLLQQRRPTSSWTPDRVWSEDILQGLAPFAVSGPAARATLNLYLAELCGRYLLAAQGSIGDPLTPQAHALLDLIDRNRDRM